MPSMGKYCKAYLVSSVREYPNWTEKLQNLRQPERGDAEPLASRTALKDDDIVYLQENYCVTDDCYKDEYVIFDNVTDEWRRFCEEQMSFSVPDEVAEMSASGATEEPRAVHAAGK
jgi:hypothetical protein